MAGAREALKIHVHQGETLPSGQTEGLKKNFEKNHLLPRRVSAVEYHIPVSKPGGFCLAAGVALRWGCGWRPHREGSRCITSPVCFRSVTGDRVLHILRESREQPLFIRQSKKPKVWLAGSRVEGYQGSHSALQDCVCVPHPAP